MEAPDKIYVYIPDDDIVGTASVKKGVPHQFVTEEYTRIDAFIKEACVKLKKLMYDNLMFQGRLHREEVIDNFVEDFKKYMEG